MLPFHCHAALAHPVPMAHRALHGGAAQAAAQPLIVQALVSVPSLSITPPGSLFFKPTCIGASSQRDIILHNTSQVPVVYQVWLLPHVELFYLTSTLCCAVKCHLISSITHLLASYYNGAEQPTHCPCLSCNPRVADQPIWKLAHALHIRLEPGSLPAQLRFAMLCHHIAHQGPSRMHKCKKRQYAAILLHSCHSHMACRCSGLYQRTCRAALPRSPCQGFCKAMSSRPSCGLLLHQTERPIT